MTVGGPSAEGIDWSQRRRQRRGSCSALCACGWPSAPSVRGLHGPAAGKPPSGTNCRCPHSGQRFPVYSAELTRMTASRGRMGARDSARGYTLVNAWIVTTGVLGGSPPAPCEVMTGSWGLRHGHPRTLDAWPRAARHEAAPTGSSGPSVREALPGDQRR